MCHTLAWPMCQFEAIILQSQSPPGDSRIESGFIKRVNQCIAGDDCELKPIKVYMKSFNSPYNCQYF